MNSQIILNKEFRISPLYTLREWNVLSHQERELISGLHDEVNVYGIFTPLSAESNLTSKVAYHDLAFVYIHLAHSSKLPHHLATSNEDSFNQAIVRLVLDQVIEIRWKEKFVSGVQAVEAIFGEEFFNSLVIPDFISILSNRGIQYACQLDKVELRTIAKKLYTYNTLPWDSLLRRNFNETTNTRDFIFSDSCV